MADSEEISSFLIAVIAVIESHYSKANKVADADVFMTTQQIADEIADIYPDVDLAALAQLLYKSGFKFEMIGDMQFAWLLKRD